MCNEMRCCVWLIAHISHGVDLMVDGPRREDPMSQEQLVVCLQDRSPFTLTILSVDDDVLRIKRGSDL